jgi:hypothetical protein
MTTNREVWEIANRKRHWLTAEEFLAQVEAHKAAKLKVKRERPAPFLPGPFVRTYLLNRNLKFTPRVKAPVTPKQEVTP